MRRIYGVDFSGAVDAGRRIWIASGTADGTSLRIGECLRGEELPGSSRDRERCFAALGAFVRSQPAGAFGFDFPFGLPASFLAEGSWENFIRSFGRRHPDPQTFLASCRRAGGNRELKRRTDRESRTPFSPYNLRVYRQTYFGIRDLLAPLVISRSACVLPMQRPLQQRPWILEICPASFLKVEEMYLHYKGQSQNHRASRENILAHIERKLGVSLAGRVREAALADDNGDALDSVVAALATFRAIRDGATRARRLHASYRLEGRVFPLWSPKQP